MTQKYNKVRFNNLGFMVSMKDNAPPPPPPPYMSGWDSLTAGFNCDNLPLIGYPVGYCYILSQNEKTMVMLNTFMIKTPNCIYLLSN